MDIEGLVPARGACGRAAEIPATTAMKQRRRRLAMGTRRLTSHKQKPLAYVKRLKPSETHGPLQSPIDRPPATKLALPLQAKIVKGCIYVVLEWMHSPNHAMYGKN